MTKDTPAYHLPRIRYDRSSEDGYADVVCTVGGCKARDYNWHEVHATVWREAARDMLGELGENPLPGARYAYTVVRRWLRSMDVL